MTQQPVTPTPAPEAPLEAASPLGPGEHPTLGRVLRDQRKTLWVAFVLAAASFWVLGQLDRWTLAGCLAAGVLLGLVNHLATEWWLLRVLTSGEQPTRRQMIVATLVRIGVLTVVALTIAVVFWPDGVGLLLGLAVFRLIALAMTSALLLKELKKP